MLQRHQCIIVESSQIVRTTKNAETRKGRVAVVWTFELQDDSEIFVECSDGQKFDFNIE